MAGETAGARVSVEPFELARLPSISVKTYRSSGDDFSTDLGIGAAAILLIVRISALPLLGDQRP